MPASRPPGPPAPASLTPVDWNRRALWLLGGLLILRVVYAAIFPLDLAPDESYYWDWGRRPDIGYFSKPPMIGWLMGLAGWIGRDSEFGLKLFPGILATGGLGFVYLLGRDLYGGRAGWMAVVLLAATPANVALNTFFTIDAPLFLFWSASLWFAWRWASAPREPWWAALLVLGLGAGFLTKQIQLAFPLLFLVFLLAARSGEGRPAKIMRFGFISGLALLFLLPPILWNWRHDWITFRHTADEIEHNPFNPWRSLKFFAEFVGGQAALGGGMTWMLMIGAMFHGAARWKGAEDRTRFLVLFGLPGFLAFSVFAFQQRVEQNWPMVFYTAAVLLAAGRLDARSAPGARAGTRFRVSVGLGAALAAGLLAVPFILPHSPISGAKADPTARVRGWRQLAERIAEFRPQVPRPDRTILLAPDDRYVASALAFYLPDHPRTFCWEDEARPESQYGIWGRPANHLGWDALVIVTRADAPAPLDVAGRFESWEHLGEVVISLGARSDRTRQYQVFLGRSLRSVAPLAVLPPER